MTARTIGLGPCINCGAQVEYKVTKQERVRFACNASVDPKGRGCGLEVWKFGKPDSDRIIEQMEKQSNDRTQNEGHGAAGRAGSEDGPAGGGSSPAEASGNRPAETGGRSLFG